MALSENVTSALLYSTVAAGALAAAAALVFAPYNHAPTEPKTQKTSSVDCKDVLNSQGSRHPLQILGCHLQNGFALKAD